MTAEEASSVQIDTGNPVMDSDHSVLIELLESFEYGCKDRVALDGGCAHCSDATTEACRARLMNIIGKVQKLLLDHFEHENELMDSLPRTAVTKSHCVRHRREHVSFSTRYNHAVASLDARQPGIDSRQIEALVSEWIRSHMHAYDVELHSLLTAAGMASQGAR